MMACLQCGAVLKLSSATAASASDLIGSMLSSKAACWSLHSEHASVELHVILLVPLLLAMTHYYSSFLI